MIKAVLLLAVIGIAFAQKQSMVYKSLPAEVAGASGAEHSSILAGRHTAMHAGRHTTSHGGRSALEQTGSQAGSTNIFMRMLNNPLRLCKETENMKAIPCARNNICNTVSMMQYRMPNLLTCSPMGVGCCVKDVMSLHIIKLLR